MSIMKPPFHTELNLGHRLSQGIVGCWLFNEAPPPLGSAMDLSGNGNHGRLVGNTHSVPGPRGPVLDFDGVGDYVNCGINLTVQSHTAIAWIKVDDITSAHTAVIVEHGTDIISAGFVFGIRGSSNDELAFAYNDGSVRGWYKDTGPSILEGTWVHVAYTWDSVAGQVAFFQNGISTSTISTTTGTIVYDGGDEFFITRPATSSFNTDFNGQISDVTIWARALSAGEIFDLYRDPFQMFKRNL